MRFTEFISEAGSPAQQAAIAIAMKKAGKKPKDVAEGSPNADVKKQISKFEELALAANRAGDDAKCKQYQQKIQSLKQKMSQGVAEGAPELLKKEMPLHRHAEKLLAQNGVSEDDPDYHHHLNNTIKHLRQFGNIDLINKSDEPGVAEGLNEFAQGNGGDDGESFDPDKAKMAHDHGFGKGVALANGLSLASAFKITSWDQVDGGLYKQHFVQGFKEGRMNKINHNNKQYNLNLKLMKDGSIRHGEQGVAEGWSKRDQKDVDAIKAAIEKLQAQLNNPNADKESIRQSIAHERKRLALYGQGVAEGLNESDRFTSWYDWKDQAKSSGYTITKKDDKIVALNKQGQVVGHWSDVGKFLSGKAPRPNFKRPEEQGVAEGEYDSRKPFGVRYKVFAGREDRVTTKEYWTTSEEKLQTAVAKIEALDNFYEIDGYSYPKEQQGVAEEWSKKYKSSINCSHPKGFSQKAHCAGKKKHNESIMMEMVCEDCGMCQTHGDHENLDEACWKGYHKEGNKKMFGKTYPNCVKNTNEEQLDEKCWDSHKQVGMKNKGGRMVPNCVPKESAESTDQVLENLHKWFKEKWVRFGPDGKIRGDCARGSESEGKPKCLPQSKAHSLGKKGRASAASRKRREDPNANRSGKAINVSTKGKGK